MKLLQATEKAIAYEKDNHTHIVFMEGVESISFKRGMRTTQNKIIFFYKEDCDNTMVLDFTDVAQFEAWKQEILEKLL
jgi:hypothetical protein